MRYLPLALLLAVGTAAAEQRVICPTEIAESSIKVTNISTQWHPYIASPLYLSSAGATAGPPERLATLMGESTWKRGREEWSTTYDLSDASFKEGKWMECRYGEYGEVVLSTRLDSQTKTCKVHFSKGEKAGQKSISIECR